MLGELPRHPPHAVLAVQLGGKCPPRETVAQPILGEPCGVLAVPVEPEPWPHVTDEIVHRAEAVIRAAGLAPEQRRQAAGVHSCRRDLEQPDAPNGVDELRIRVIGLLAAGEGDAYAVGPVGIGEHAEESVGLLLELPIRCRHERSVRSARCF